MNPTMLPPGFSPRTLTRGWPVLFILMAGSLSAAQDEALSPSQDYAAFRLVSERNIFNLNRSPQRVRTATQSSREQPAPTESFALVGTVSYDKGTFALFTGSKPEYKLELQIADTIADYRIAAITQAEVKLESGDRTVDLPVGMQMARQDQGEWKLASYTPPSRTSSQTSSGGSERFSSRGSDRDSDRSSRWSSAPSVESPDPSSIGDPDEILRRLMQRRMQEMGLDSGESELSPAREIANGPPEDGDAVFIEGARRLRRFPGRIDESAWSEAEPPGLTGEREATSVRESDDKDDVPNESVQEPEPETENENP